MSQTTFRSLYSETCRSLLELRGEVPGGKVGDFLQSCDPPRLPEASSTASSSWADQEIEGLEEVRIEVDPVASRLLNAVRNLEHLFDCAWEAGFKNEAQAFFYRLTRDLLQAVERDGYIPGREAEDDDEETEEEEESDEADALEGE